MPQYNAMPQQGAGMYHTMQLPLSAAMPGQSTDFGAATGTPYPRPIVGDLQNNQAIQSQIDAIRQRFDDRINQGMGQMPAAPQQGMPPLQMQPMPQPMQPPMQPMQPPMRAPQAPARQPEQGPEFSDRQQDRLRFLARQGGNVRKARRLMKQKNRSVSYQPIEG